MKMRIKKLVAVVLAGVFLLTGAAGMTAEAAGGKVMCHKVPDPARVTAWMSETYGVSQVALLKHYAGGMKLRDLQRAAYYAAVSGKTLDEIITLKNDKQTWREVGRSLAITKEQHKALRQKLFAGRLQQRTGVLKESSLALLQSGKKMRDVAVAGFLAKHSGKKLEDIIALKTKDKKWRAVGAELGIEQEQAAKVMKQAKQFMDGCHKQHMKR